MNAVVESVKPLYILGRIFGFFPFKFSENGDVKLSIFGFLHAIGIFLILDFILYLRLIHKDNYKQQGSVVSQFTFFCAILFCVCFAVVLILINFIQRKKFKKALKSISKFDAKVKFLFFCNINYKKQSQRAVFMFISNALTYTLVTLIPWYCYAILIGAETEEIFTTTLLHLMWYGILFYTVICILAIEIIYNRFKIFNEILSKVKEKEMIRNVAVLYLLLCHTLTIFNQIYSPLIALFFGCCLLCGTFVFYELFDIVYYSHENGGEFKMKIFVTFIIVMMNFQFVNLNCIFINISSKTMREGKKGDKILCESFCISKPNLLTCKRVLLFNLQLQHKEPEITCGMFKFDWSIIHNFFAATLSYLVIMIQFTQNRKSN
ncbi:hypothetical protein PVAND_014493 [Polypedilum vanderplanki]|uniref:Gustatory receptor n=1 Tax=Polypedilum vanderplanki TaxID=319348 RepID=A0A9J6B9T4_POLVA|nr:hypothetical protein PVAND_014493 [Polypedilum vanderplanki]